jgi:oxygen-independent coproporphyrinogen-3 oxidase
MTSAIYIHIPFCKTHCPYCDFAVWVISHPRHANTIEAYIDSLCLEIKDRSHGEYIQTIYFGGGTPSILSSDQLSRIMQTLKENFQVSHQAEITLETNPGTVDLEKLKSIRQLGFNRLSIGVQTFDSELLQKLARGHNKEDALKTLSWAKEAGFENISLDLIFGLPGQSMSSWEDTIDQALSEQIQHISCYALTIEEGTPFHKMYSNSNHTHTNSAKNSVIPSEEITVQMYEKLQVKLLEKGFEQYEVSNFAKTGFQSKHNLTYWRNEEFYGYGVSAHEFIKGERKSHNRNLEEYIQNPHSQIILDCNPALEELMLKLRTNEGLNLIEYQKKFDINLLTQKEKQIKQFQEAELIILSENNLKLTSKGFILSTYLIGELAV